MKNENWISFEIKSMGNLIGELGEVIARHILSKIYEPCTVYGDTPTADKYYEYEFERDQSIKKVYMELQGGGWDLLVDKYTEDQNFRDKVVLVEVKTHIDKSSIFMGRRRKDLRDKYRI